MQMFFASFKKQIFRIEFRTPNLLWKVCFGANISLDSWLNKGISGKYESSPLVRFVPWRTT